MDHNFWWFSSVHMGAAWNMGNICGWFPSDYEVHPLHSLFFKEVSPIALILCADYLPMSQIICSRVGISLYKKEKIYSFSLISSRNCCNRSFLLLSCSTSLLRFSRLRSMNPDIIVRNTMLSLLTSCWKFSMRFLTCSVRDSGRTLSSSWKVWRWRPEYLRPLDFPPR